MGSSCYSRGNRDNLIRLREYIWKNDIRSEIVLKGCRCGSCCSNGPNIWIEEQLYPGITEEKVGEFLEILREQL